METSNQSFEAMVPTLKRVAAALRDSDVPYLLAGSLACWARGGPESSHDLDFVVKPDDADRALAALEAAGMSEREAPEEWLRKACDGDVEIDIIFEPTGVDVRDGAIERGDDLDVAGMSIHVMALEDVFVTKLLSLKEHYLNYESLLHLARPLREQVDWAEVRERTAHSPYAKAFFVLIEELGIVEAAPAR